MSDATVQDEPENKAESAPSNAPLAPSPSKEPLVGEVLFNESIIIYSGSRLPQYDKGPVKAYAAYRSDKVPNNLFALICEENLTPRVLKAANYVSVANPSLIRLVASGVTDWPPAGKQKYCFVYENALGNPLMKNDTVGGLGMKPEVVLSGAIRPLVGVLINMRDKDIVHGNIRLSNIFDGGGSGADRLVLGECLSTPPSYLQPVLYETINRGLCSPIGRGIGTIQDDLYALGVCLAIMLRHNDPAAGLSDEEIIEQKIQEGSYSLLLGKDRVSGGMLELLRGLLYDDENQRWTLDDLIIWLDGRRVTSKQAYRRTKASRPINFNGEKYLQPEVLVRDFIKNPPEARKLIEEGELEQWIFRALDDKVMLERFRKSITLAEEGGKSGDYTDRLLTRVSIALYPEGSMRYRTINIFPDGIGAALADAFVMKRDLQAYNDFFMNYFITQWVDSQERPVADAGNMVGKHDGARSYLRQKTMGGGLEKCLYALNPEIHCLSEKIQRYLVRSPEDLMRAFEKMSTDRNRPALFFDRHIVAYLSVKERKNIDPYINDLNAPEPYRRSLGEAKTLATLQKRANMEGFPGICKWVVEILEPAYERFHDRQLRVDIKRKAERLLETGDIAKIITLFDNPTVYQNDNAEFRKAMRRYHELEQEIIDTERSLRDEATFGQDTGHQIAAIVSAVLAGIIVLLMAFSAFNGGGHNF